MRGAVERHCEGEQKGCGDPQELSNGSDKKVANQLPVEVILVVDEQFEPFTAERVSQGACHN